MIPDSAIFAAIRQFVMTRSNLAEFSVYWLPDRQCISARSVYCAKRHAIPDGAVFVGNYAAPFSVDAFLVDLRCAMTAHEHRSAVSA